MEYVGPIKPDIEYVGAKGEEAPKPTSDYHPTEIVGRCMHDDCAMIGWVDFPPGSFSWDMGDDIMSFEMLKSGKILCSGCNRKTIFKPVSPKDLEQENLKVIAQAQEARLELIRKYEERNRRLKDG